MERHDGITEHVATPNWEQTFQILREKSTLAGLTGLGVAIAAMFGHQVSPEDHLVITEMALTIISIVAIATRPRDKPRYDRPDEWHDRASDNIVRDDRSSHSPVSGPSGGGEVRPEPAPKSKEAGEGN